MTNRDAQLLGILQIGHAASIKGEGISIREALSRTHYKELRSGFGPSELLPLIQSNRTFVEEWLAFSEDKRTTEGWYILRNGEIGQVHVDGTVGFASMEEAVANYVVREMDFWVSVRHAG